MRNQQNVKVRVNSSFETICPFPVGYVYMSSNNTSPANIYGGTWSPISGGRYMRAASAWGNGGSNTITIQQMPAHTHTITRTLQNTVSPGGKNIVASGSTEGDAYSWITSSTGGGSILPHLPKRLGVVQNCLKKVMLHA